MGRATAPGVELYGVNSLGDARFTYNVAYRSAVAIRDYLTSVQEYGVYLFEMIIDGEFVGFLHLDALPISRTTPDEVFSIS